MRIKSTDAEVTMAVAASTSIRGVLVLLGRNPTGEAHRAMARRVQRLGLSTAHFKRPGLPPAVSRRKKPLSEYLKKGVVCNLTNLKNRLLREGVLIPKCSECGLDPVWQGNPLSLHLDHIDGDRTNNELPNLRFLCPNCHSQTPTYAGRNVKDRRVFRCGCGRKITREAARCRFCANALPRNRYSQTKAVWPSDEDLARAVWETPVMHIAKGLGVSDAAVRKRCKKRGIALPTNKHWAAVKKQQV